MMTRDEAMDLVKQVCAGFQGTLQDHVKIQEAIKAIEVALVPVEVEAEED